MQSALQILSLKYLIGTEESRLVIAVSQTIEIGAGMMECAHFQTGHLQNGKWVVPQSKQFDTDVLMWLHISSSCETKGNKTPPNVIYGKFTFGNFSFDTSETQTMELISVLPHPIKKKKKNSFMAYHQIHSHFKCTAS